jgi:hypothetical protein
MSIDKIATNDEPYSLYLFYLIPSEGYRGKVLNFRLDSESEGDQLPYSYFFMQNPYASGILNWRNFPT